MGKPNAGIRQFDWRASRPSTFEGNFLVLPIIMGREVNINGVNYAFFSNFFVFRFCSTPSPHKYSFAYVISGSLACVPPPSFFFPRTPGWGRGERVRGCAWRK